MRRGESKAKGLRRGGQTRSVATKAKARAGPKDASTAALAKKLATKARELDETLEREAAASEVLRVISSSPGELEPVFRAVLENAVRICGAKFGTLSLYNGDTFRNVALHNVPPGYADLRLREPFRPHPKSGLAHVAATKQIAQINDLRAEPPYLEDNPAVVAIVDLAGARTILIVPMLKESTLVGTISIFRQEVRLFKEKQIELVTNFANQAVIAIENARLFDEVQARTKELTESLEQQTATSEVLQVISSSPGELEPIFQTMLANATRLCEASYGALWLCEGDAFRVGAFHGSLPATYTEQWRSGAPYRPGPDTPLARVAESHHAVQVADLRESRAYLSGEALAVSAVDVAGIRTLVTVPMLKEDELVGVIVIYRQEVRPFTDKQIELVTNFAKQAVIAIENTRLLNELREVVAAANRNCRRA